MIVLFNVKITDVRMGFPYHIGRGSWMPEDTRYDVFRYCLASTAALNPLVTKFIFFITLAPELQHRQAELDEYMHSLFPKEKLVVNWQRLDYGRDWRRACDQYLSDPNELVWLACNDDHIFVDNTLDIVAGALEHLRSDPDPNAIFYYSHWPEQMRVSHGRGGELTQDGDFIRFEWETFDGIMILKAGRLSKYFERDYGDALMFKVDYLGAYHNYSCPGPVYAPTKEVVRHYEGYAHVAQEHIRQLSNTVPPLFVPPGFWQGNMKIRIGFSDRNGDYTNFNPAAEWLFNASAGGTDYRWLESDIPLFWRGKVKEIVYADDFDTVIMQQARDAAYRAAGRLPMYCYNWHYEANNVPPDRWFAKHCLSQS